MQSARCESSELCAIWLSGLAYLDGTLDARVWRGFERSLADIAAYPGFQSWWLTRKHWYSDEFRALLDSHIQTGKPTIYEDYT